MPSEKSVEAWVVRLAEKRGGRALKSEGISTGFPDRIVLIPQGRVFFVETKTKGGRVAAAQRIWHKLLRMWGFTVYMPYDTDAVQRIFNEEE